MNNIARSINIEAVLFKQRRQIEQKNRRQLAVHLGSERLTYVSQNYRLFQACFFDVVNIPLIFQLPLLVCW